MRQNEHEFLEMSYIGVDFLINRNQFTNSIFIGNESNIKLKIKYIDRIITYNKERLLCFNLDLFLKDLFKFDDNENNQLALISNTETFFLNHRKLFKKLTENAKEQLSDAKIAIRIGNESKITKIKLSEIKLFTNSIYKKLIKCGLLGVRLITNKKVQYFIDIEKFIFDAISL